MSSSTTLPMNAARLPPLGLRPMRSMAGPATPSTVLMASLSNRRVSGDAMIACADSIASCRPWRPWRVPM